jgi:hypothetical protein
VQNFLQERPRPSVLRIIENLFDALLSTTRSANRYQHLAGVEPARVLSEAERDIGAAL